MTQDPSIPFPPTVPTLQPPPAPTQATPAWIVLPPFVEPIPERTAARVIVAAIAAGILGQMLFIGQQAGANVLIWVALVLAAAWSLRRPGARMDRYDLWLPPAALAFAAFIWLRDDAGLFLFDLAMAGALTLAGVVAIGGHPVTRRTWSGIAQLAGGAIAVAWAGGGSVADGFRPIARTVSVGGHATSARILRGLLIAVPLMLGFTLLFAAADGVFQSYVSSLMTLPLDPGELIARAVFAFALGWVFAGTMAAAWLSRERFRAPTSADVDTQSVPATRRRLGTIEALVVLVALDALFMAFVLIQATYLFPGSDPLATAGMTYSAYARRGFFELVAVAVLVGGLIIFLDAIVERRSAYFRIASGVLTVLTGAVLVSATTRLVLYQQAYGWTELRFYVLAAICWLAAGLFAALVALAVGRVSVMPKFMFGAALVVALVCNAIGPQSFSTARNLQRAIDPTSVPADGHVGLDTFYFESLGADSIPVMVASLGQLQPDQREELVRLLRLRARDLRLEAMDFGWPSWNLSKQHALEALAAAGF